ncbi:MAG: archease [Methanomicrobiaceae archaeon]|nr:archease [Methanomicrobiaceae archaeon]
MPFTELEHTADILVRVNASSIEHLFAEAARAMFSFMHEQRKGGPVARTLTLEAADMDTLLHDFLSELLYAAEVDNLVFSDVDVSISGSTLAATAYGEPFDPDVHAEGAEIKGVSYYGLQIRKTEQDNHYRVDILFDV